MNRGLLRRIVSHYKLDPYGALLVAIIVQAIDDARREDQEGRIARYWLEDRGYVWICERLKIPYYFIDEVVRLA